MALSSSLDYKVPLYSTSNFIKDSFGEHLLNENQENFSICIDRSIKDRRKIQINKALKEFDRKVENQSLRYKEGHELKLSCKHTQKLKRKSERIFKPLENDRKMQSSENFQSLDKLAHLLSQKQSSKEDKIKYICNIRNQIKALEKSIHI